jgi:hypothetical protein
MRKWRRYAPLGMGVLWCGVLLSAYSHPSSRLTLLVVSLLGIAYFTLFAFNATWDRETLIGKCEEEIDSVHATLEKIALHTGENLAAGFPVVKPEKKKAHGDET